MVFFQPLKEGTTEEQTLLRRKRSKFVSGELTCSPLCWVDDELISYMCGQKGRGRRAEMLTAGQAWSAAALRHVVCVLLVGLLCLLVVHLSRDHGTSELIMDGELEDVWCAMILVTGMSGVPACSLRAVRGGRAHLRDLRLSRLDPRVGLARIKLLCGKVLTVPLAADRTSPATRRKSLLRMWPIIAAARAWRRAKNRLAPLRGASRASRETLTPGLKGSRSKKGASASGVQECCFSLGSACRAPRAGSVGDGAAGN